MTLLLFHGWHSAPGGVNPTFLAQYGQPTTEPRQPPPTKGEIEELLAVNPQNGIEIMLPGH